MVVDLATFRAIFPEFDTVADATVLIFIDDAEEMLSAAAWGKCYPRAALNYAAHNLAISQGLAASASQQGDNVVIPQSGKLQSGSEEGISFAFEASTANKSAAGEWWSQTPYGQAYLALQRQCLSRAQLSW